MAQGVEGERRLRPVRRGTGEGMQEREEEARTAQSRRRPDAMLVGGALLVVLQTVVRAAVVLPSFYWQDDFVHMDLAQRLGLSREFLLRDHNDHLGIGPSLVYWLLGRHTGLSFLPAALCLLVMQLMASILLLAVLRELFGRSLWLLVPFAAYLFTPLQLPVASWWAAGLEALPLQIGMLAAVLGLVRALRQRSWRWAAFSVAGHALGLLFYEKSLLILPVLLAVLVWAEWADQPLGRALRRAGRAWRYLVPHVLLIAAYVPLYLSVVDSDAGLVLRTGDVLPTVGETVFQMLVPGLFGGPWTDAGAQNTVAPAPGPARVAAFALLALAVVAVSVWLRGRRALRAWCLAGSVLVVDLALVQVARTQFIDEVARDPRYLTDALPVIVIGVCAAFTGPLVPRRAPRWAGSVRSSSVAAPVGVALVVASGLTTTSLVADEMQHRGSRDFVHDVLQAMDDNPGVSVISNWAGFEVNIFLEPDLEGVLRTLGQDRPFDQPGTDVRMFDQNAELHPVVLVERTLEASGPVGGCGWQMTAAWQRLAELPDPGPGKQALQLGYRTDRGATLHLAMGEDEQVLVVPPGAGHATFVIAAQDGPIEARISGPVSGAPASSLCIGDVAVGAPYPLLDP